MQVLFIWVLYQHYIHPLGRYHQPVKCIVYCVTTWSMYMYLIWWRGHTSTMAIWFRDCSQDSSMKALIKRQAVGSGQLVMLMAVTKLACPLPWQMTDQVDMFSWYMMNEASSFTNDVTRKQDISNIGPTMYKAATLCIIVPQSLDICGPEWSQKCRMGSCCPRRLSDGSPWWISSVADTNCWSHPGLSIKC